MQLPPTPWNSQMDAYKAAQAEEITALETFLSTPRGHRQSRSDLLAAKRKVRDAELALWEAYLDAQDLKG